MEENNDNDPGLAWLSSLSKISTATTSLGHLGDYRPATDARDTYRYQRPALALNNIRNLSTYYDSICDAEVLLYSL